MSLAAVLIGGLHAEASTDLPPERGSRVFAGIRYVHAGGSYSSHSHGLSAIIGHELHQGDHARGGTTRIGMAVAGETLAIEARSSHWRSLGGWGRLHCDLYAQRTLSAAYAVPPTATATCGSSLTKRLGARTSATATASAMHAQKLATVSAGLALSMAPASSSTWWNLSASANGSRTRTAVGESKQLSAGVSAYYAWANGASLRGGPTWSVQRWRHAARTAWGRFESAGESRNAGLSVVWSGPSRPGRWTPYVSVSASWSRVAAAGVAGSASESQGVSWMWRRPSRDSQEWSASVDLSRSVQRSTWGELSDVRATVRIRRSFGLGLQA